MEDNLTNKKSNKGYLIDSVYEVINIEECLRTNTKITKIQKEEFFYLKYLEKKTNLENKPISNSEWLELKQFTEKFDQNKHGIKISDLYIETTNGYILNLLEHFKLLDILGEGGFGIVISAFDNNKGIKIAIKVIPKSKKGKLKQNSEQEINIQSQIEHKNVVHLYDVQENFSYVFLFMEIMEGGTLKDLIIQRYSDSAFDYLFTEDEIRIIINNILNGLDYIHSQQIMHRDIKPGNNIK